jgi:hypothetical protein
MFITTCEKGRLSFLLIALAAIGLFAFGAHAVGNDITTTRACITSNSYDSGPKATRQTRRF